MNRKRLRDETHMWVLREWDASLSSALVMSEYLGELSCYPLGLQVSEILNGSEGVLFGRACTHAEGSSDRGAVWW